MEPDTLSVNMVKTKVFENDIQSREVENGVCRDSVDGRKGKFSETLMS